MAAPASNFYVTTPIYYVNDVPHVGHTYTTVAADALARYHRARGHATWFLTGTDEHGEKIEEVAKKNGTTPKAWADRTMVRFKDAWVKMEISYDDFIRTTDERHEKVVADMWKRMAAAGDLYLGEFEGKYCVGCEEKKNDSELVDGFCPLHPGRALKTVKEASWYFRMSKYQDRLLEHFAKHPDFVVPESRRNEIVSFVKSGLRDLSVSRTTFSWGIPVPGDPKHVIYVWIDALTNYVSALGGPGAEKYEAYWSNAVHLVGKDIIRFHAVYWPCMLMSAGLPLPKQILAHGWWTVRGQKISKSLPATKVDPNVISDDIGADVLRYFLLNEIPLGQDGDFSYEALIARNNSDLANDLGNLVNRTVSMCEKYFGGKVPPAHPELDAREPHATLSRHARSAREGAEKGFDTLSPHDALKAIWELVRAGNKYVDTTAPWTLAKDPAKKQELEHAVHSFLEAALWAAKMAAPVMPVKCDAILTQLGVPKDRRASWPREWNQELPAGTVLARGEPVFPRIDDKREAELLAKWIPADVLAAGEAKPAEPAKKDAKKKPAAGPAESVAFDEFARLDLRVALVKTAERVEGKTKLLKLSLDVGAAGVRQVVAGIAEAYAPETLVGKKVLFLANLAPAKIGGIESQGMVLAVGDEKILGLSATDVDVPPGTKVR
ncbi:MAG TPA: methionine--tRNA ligase [bacterium]|nr:methionine--tRNA ligase [bacterium]